MEDVGGMSWTGCVGKKPKVLSWRKVNQICLSSKSGSWQCKSCLVLNCKRWYLQSNPVKSNQIQSNQIKSNQIKSNQIKVWLCWTIFVIKIVCAPLNLIFGGIFYNESSEQPHLPPLMIAGGLLEVACPAFLWWNSFPSGKRENILKLSALTGALGPSCLLLICDASLQEGELILWCPVRCTEHKLRKALQNRKNFVGSSFQHPYCNSGQLTKCMKLVTERIHITRRQLFNLEIWIF